MKCKKTGIRQVKAHLCAMLKEVGEGTEIIITERGKPIARIVPVTEDSLTVAEKISNAERLGWISPVSPEKSKSIPAPFSVSGERARKFLEEARR